MSFNGRMIYEDANITVELGDGGSVFVENKADCCGASLSVHPVGDKLRVTFGNCTKVQLTLGDRIDDAELMVGRTFRNS